MQKNSFFVNKFLPILVMFIVIINIVFVNISFGATYDLSDYKNCNLMNNGWCIVYSESNDKFYLITLERTDYPYLCAICSVDENGNYYPSSEWTSFKRLGDYNSQGGTFCYTFNAETNKFENRTSYGIGKLKLGVTKVIAAGTDVYVTHRWSSFFHQTPVPLQVIIQPTLAETLKKELGEMITSIIMNMKTIIPIGLLVLSIGLLIYLIKSVISQAT